MREEVKEVRGTITAVSRRQLSFLIGKLGMEMGICQHKEGV